MEEQCGFNKKDLKLHEDPSKFPIINTWKVHKDVDTKIIHYWLVELINKEKDVTRPIYKEVKVSALYGKDHKWVGLQEAIELVKFEEMIDLFLECDSYINTKILPANK